MEVGEDSSPDRRPYKVTPTVASVTAELVVMDSIADLGCGFCPL